ncbi:MAG: glycosyltransferase family 39 protein, partial [Cyanobacteria bacterium P01_A01_bin.135]
LFTGEVTTPQDWLRYQQFDPERGWGDTLYALSTHPEHPPLYYLLLRGWMGLFGDMVAAVRSLSVVFALLCFPALYWLCRELFTERVGSVAVALWAVSPVHVLYSQEARPYSLWTLLTLLLTALLLWALRRGSRASWVAYGVMLTVSAYTSLFTAMVWVSHGLYLGLSKRLGSLLNWLLATVLAGFLFSPWLFVILVNRDRFQEKTSWVNFDAPFPILTKLWGLHISSVLIDLGLPLEHPYTYIAPALVLPLLGWALWTLCRHAPRRTWLLLVLMLVVPPAMLILPDLLRGGQRSLNTRYFFPTLNIAVVVMAYLLAHLWQRRPRLAAGVMALVFTAGVVSCSLSAISTAWWNKGLSYHNVRIAAVINRLEQPIMVSAWSNNLLGNLVSLAYYLDEDVQLQIFADTPLPPFPDDGRDRILFELNERLIESVTANGYTVEGFTRDNVPLLRLTRPGP